MSIPKDHIPPQLRGGHPLITWASLQCLPDWQRELWEPQMLAMAEVYCGYGDTYFTNKERLAPFVELPDGSVPKWEIGVLRLKKNYGFAVDFWESPCYEEHERVFTHFFRRIAESLAAKDVLTAAQLAGTMAHHIEDSGVPAHSADNGDLEFVKDYIKVPKKHVSFPLHGYTEQSPAPFLVNDYVPRLYGQTPEEAGCNYLDRYIELTLYARKLLFPLAKAAFSGKDQAGKALRQKAAVMCAKAYADFMGTATCLGAGRFDPKAVRSLRTLRLTNRWPYRMSAWAPAPYFEPGPLALRGVNLDTQRNPVPCELLIQKKEEVVPTRFKEALGSGAYFEYHYKLPAGVYHRFTTRVGIHAVLGARRSINVEVKLDGQIAFKDVIYPGKPALRIDLDARGCRDLQMIASGPWLTEPDGADNHVVWAEPRLTK